MDFLHIIEGSEGCFLSAVTLLETRLVLRGRFGIAALADLDSLMQEIEPEIVAFDKTQADAAFEAFQVYGKGIHPKAKLNLGDCASYALAKSHDLPLLFKGDDFASTDIRVAR